MGADEPQEPDYAPTVLELRAPRKLGSLVLGVVLVGSMIGLPLFLWLGALHGVAIRCERAGVGAEPVCAMEYNYGLFETAVPLATEDVRQARVEAQMNKRTDTVTHLGVVPRREERDVLRFTRPSTLEACEADVAALRGFLAAPRALAVRIDRDAYVAWWYLLVLVPEGLLALFGGLLQFETRRVTVRRDAGELLVRERALERAFLERTIESIPLADIRWFSTGSSLRRRTLTVSTAKRTRVVLWESEDEEATEAAADRLAEFVGVHRIK